MSEPAEEETQLAEEGGRPVRGTQASARTQLPEHAQDGARTRSTPRTAPDAREAMPYTQHGRRSRDRVLAAFGSCFGYKAALRSEHRSVSASLKVSVEFASNIRLRHGSAALGDGQL